MSSIERSLVLIKPDGVIRGRIGQILTKFEDACLKIRAMKMVQPTKELLEQHYLDDPEWKKATGTKIIASKAKQGIIIKESPEEVAEEIRRKLIKGLEIGPVVAMLIEGNEVIAKVRSLAGNTNPIEAIPGSIRGDLCSDSYVLADALHRPLFNLVHASDSVKNAEREMKVWFEEKDMVTYKRSPDYIYYEKGD